jgi:hypothetical protein
MNILLLVFFILIKPAAQAIELKAQGFQVNDDGTVLVRVPFLELNQEMEFISAEESNLPAVCEAFGLRGYSLGNWYQKGKKVKNVALYLGPKSVRKGKNLTQIDWMMCRTAEPGVATLTSHRATIRERDSMSVTIEDPMYLGPNSNPIPISNESHFDGVCRLFGFEKFIEGQSVIVDSKPVSKLDLQVSIGHYGGFRTFLSESKKQVSKLTCERSVQYRLKITMDPEQLTRSLKEISKGLDPLWSKIIVKLSDTMDLQYPVENWQSNRQLDTTRISPALLVRFLVMHWLNPFFTRYDSLWFKDQVIPKHAELQKRYHDLGLMDDRSVTDSALYLSSALLLFETLMNELLQHIDEPARKIWMSEIILKTGMLQLYLGQGAYGQASQVSALKEWVDVWKQGTDLRKDWFNFESMADVTLIIEVLGESIRRCYQN